MNLSKLFVFCLILSSCATQQRCAERFPSKETDSVKTVVSYLHDTLYKEHEQGFLYFEKEGLGIDTLINYHHEEKKGKETKSQHGNSL